MIQINGKSYLKIEEVALLVGCSTKSINDWYRFQKTEPENEYAKMLPSYKKIGPRNCRLWEMDDVYKLITFKQSIPRGRNGIMGATTQKYYHKRKED